MLMLGNLNLIHLTVQVIVVLLMSKWMDLFSMKIHLLKCRDYLSLGLSKFSLAKRASNKNGTLLYSMKFLFPGVLVKTTTLPCIE